MSSAIAQHGPAALMPEIVRLVSLPRGVQAPGLAGWRVVQ
jgi:hypothetical protein